MLPFFFPFYPFCTFFNEMVNKNIFWFFYPNMVSRKYFTPFISYILWNIENWVKISLIWPILLVFFWLPGPFFLFVLFLYYIWGTRAQVCYFLAPQKFWKKRVKKGYNKNFGQKCQKNQNFKFCPKLPYFVPLLPFLYFLHTNRFILHIRAILCKLTLLNVRYPFFKANFVQIWNLASK